MPRHKQPPRQLEFVRTFRPDEARQLRALRVILGLPPPPMEPPPPRGPAAGASGPKEDLPDTPRGLGVRRPDDDGKEE